MNNKRNHTRQLAFAGLFAAILAVLSVIQIPMPSGVPVTLQTFAVALCGCVLGRKWGFTATLLYVLIGTVGLPVFSGMKGGIGVLAGPTGGFLFGFLALAPLCGLGMELGNKLWTLGMGGIGLVICHILGALQFSIVSGRSIWEAVMLVSLPYLIKDILSLIGAGVAGAYIRRTLLAAGILDGGNTV